MARAGSASSTIALQCVDGTIPSSGARQKCMVGVAVNALMIVGTDEAYRSIDRAKMLQFLLRARAHSHQHVRSHAPVCRETAAPRVVQPSVTCAHEFVHEKRSWGRQQTWPLNCSLLGSDEDVSGWLPPPSRRRVRCAPFRLIRAFHTAERPTPHCVVDASATRRARARACACVRVCACGCARARVYVYHRGRGGF